MAEFYWYGNGGNWSDFANHWSDNSGNVPAAPKANAPTSADNVHFDALSFTILLAIVTVDADANCANMDWTGALNTPIFAGSSRVSCYGNLTFIADMSQTYLGEITLRGNGAQTFTAGVTLACSLSFNYGSGTYTLQDAVNVGSKTFSHGSGTLNTNGKTITCGYFYDYSSSARTLTLGSSVINVSGVNGWEVGGTGALTVTANTATVNLNATTPLAGGNQNYNGASFNLNGTAHTVSGSFTCATLTRNGTATKTDTVTFTSGITVTCTTCAMIGNSATNRLQMQSSTRGTPATITATNWTGTINVDIVDITATNAINLSAITGNSGDCGGNTGITFTTTAPQALTATGSWSDITKWTSRVPLPQDDVTAGGAGITITVDMPRLGKSITFTGTPTISMSNNVIIFGSLVIPSGATYTHNNKAVSYRGRDLYTLTTNGKSMYGNEMSAPNGTLTLQDDLTDTGELSLVFGTLDLNDKNVSCGTFYSTYTSTRALLLKSGTITITGTGNKWAVSSTLTLTAGTSTIVLTTATTTACTFTGGGLIYNNVTVQGAGNYTLTISGTNTFNILKVDRSGAAKTISGAVSCAVTDLRLLPSGSTTITITNTDFVKTGGRVESDYLVLSGSAASGGASFYAGSHSTDGGSNSGWLFRVVPRGAAWK